MAKDSRQRRALAQTANEMSYLQSMIITDILKRMPDNEDVSLRRALATL